MNRAVEYWQHWGNTLPHKELDLAGYAAKGDGQMIFADGFGHSDSVAHIIDHLQGPKFYIDDDGNRRLCRSWRNNADFCLIQGIFSELGKNQSAIMYTLYALKTDDFDRAAEMINQAREQLPKTQYWHESRKYDGEGKLLSKGYYYTVPIKHICADHVKTAHNSIIEYTHERIRQYEKMLTNQYAVLADLRCLQSAL